MESNQVTDSYLSLLSLSLLVNSVLNYCHSLSYSLSSISVPFIFFHSYPCSAQLISFCSINKTCIRRVWEREKTKIANNGIIKHFNVYRNSFLFPSEIMFMNTFMIVMLLVLLIVHVLCVDQRWVQKTRRSRKRKRRRMRVTNWWRTCNGDDDTKSIVWVEGRARNSVESHNTYYYI